MSNGTYDTQSGRRRRYRCTPLVGDVHKFSVVVAEEGLAQLDGSLPPVCPDHPGSKVIRYGTYGTTTEQPRQRYQCTPADEDEQHTFTPVLARGHVHVGQDQCDVCDEHRGVHHGEPAAAWRHSWSARTVAEGLQRLAGGESYASVSQWALRKSGTAARRARAVAEDDDEATAAELRRNGWRISADWVEVFGQAICNPVEQRLRRRAEQHQAANAAKRAAGEPVDDPLVVLVDDVPVYGRALEQTARRDEGFFLLVVVEQFGDGPASRAQLRLVRALAKSNTDGWRLVFDELGYTPDVIVADAGTGIGAAMRAHFDPSVTRWIPSVWHVGRTIERQLGKTKRALVKTDRGTELVKPLRDHLSKLSRNSGALDDEAAWAAWWDQLETAARSVSVPVDAVRRLRRDYEDDIAAVLDTISELSHVPIATGGIETLIRLRVKPMLANRRHAFGNLERTNALFDLVVAREHGAFDNLADVARQLRADTEAHGGFAPPVRMVDDPRPKDGYYSSLRDAQRLKRIAEARGLT